MRTSLILPLWLAAGLLARPNALFAQNQPAAPTVAQKDNRTVDVLRAYGNDSNFNTFDLRDKSIKGTPFLQPGWALATVQLSGNQKLTAVPARYDAYRRELRIRRPQGDSLIIDPRMLQTFTLQASGPAGPRERQFRRLPTLADPKLAVEYFEVLHDKNGVQVLKLERKILQRGNTDPAYGSRRNDFFEDKIEYFVRYNEASSLQPLKLTAKAVGGARPEWKKALETYGKPIRTEADLLAFVAQLP